MGGAARDKSFGGETRATGSTGGSTLSGNSGAESATVSSSANPKGRSGLSMGAASASLRALPALVTGTDAIGALGRTTELVVSFDGFCMSSASMPDVDEQPARHSDAITKLMTPGNRIWTCTRNTTDRGQRPTDNQAQL